MTRYPYQAQALPCTVRVWCVVCARNLTSMTRWQVGRCGCGVPAVYPVIQHMAVVVAVVGVGASIQKRSGRTPLRNRNRTRIYRGSTGSTS
jgi:hypothetical protein